MADFTWHVVEPGVVYEMARDDGVGGDFYHAGDPVLILDKRAKTPIECRNLRTRRVFYVAGASSFRQRVKEAR